MQEARAHKNVGYAIIKAVVLNLLGLEEPL